MAKEKILISVIVTAYNRKDYLLEALESAVNQTLSRNLYEIICIKNFRDKVIDNYIKNNNIANFFKDNAKIGEYIYIASRKASGKILCFLDDDDVFRKDKLSAVYDAFTNGKTEFYHNNITLNKYDLTNPKNEVKSLVEFTSPYKLRDYNKIHMCGFCKSAIAIKKEILRPHLRAVRNVVGNDDIFLLLISLLEDKIITMDRRQFTFYRVHANNTSKINNIEKSINFERSKNIPALFFLESLAIKGDSNLLKFYVSTVLFQARTRLAILENDKKALKSYLKVFIKENKLRILFNKPAISRFILIILFLLGSSYPKKRFLRL